MSRFLPLCRWLVPPQGVAFLTSHKHLAQTIYGRLTEQHRAVRGPNGLCPTWPPSGQRYWNRRYARQSDSHGIHLEHTLWLLPSPNHSCGRGHVPGWVKQIICLIRPAQTPITYSNLFLPRKELNYGSLITQNYLCR